MNIAAVWEAVTVAQELQQNSLHEGPANKEQRHSHITSSPQIWALVLFITNYIYYRSHPDFWNSQIYTVWGPLWGSPCALRGENKSFVKRDRKSFWNMKTEF